MITILSLFSKKFKVQQNQIEKLQQENEELKKINKKLNIDIENEREGKKELYNIKDNLMNENNKLIIESKCNEFKINQLEDTLKSNTVIINSLKDRNERLRDEYIISNVNSHVDGIKMEILEKDINKLN
eukprot:jgi/Orpsp1_1/1174155/evm.model.c7180000049111.1